MKTLIVIPAYNEGANIGGLVRRTRELAPEADCLVVDDGSQDATARQAAAAGAEVIMHPFNMGYGVALQTGYKYALRRPYQFVVQMDGDGQHDPKYIKALVDRAGRGDADVVIGSRFMSGAGYRTTLDRRIGIILFSGLVSFITRRRITDSTSGFQVLNRKAFGFLAGDIYPCDYPDADVIIMLHRARFKVEEVAVAMREKENSKSMHSGLKPLYYVFKMALSIFVTLLRKEA